MWLYVEMSGCFSFNIYRFRHLIELKFSYITRATWTLGLNKSYVAGDLYSEVNILVSQFKRGTQSRLMGGHAGSLTPMPLCPRKRRVLVEIRTGRMWRAEIGRLPRRRQMLRGKAIRRGEARLQIEALPSDTFIGADKWVFLAEPLFLFSTSATLGTARNLLMQILNILRPHLFTTF